MANKIRLCRAGDGDVSMVRAVAEAAYGLYIPRIGRRPAPMDADFKIHAMKNEIWVVDCNGVVSGFIVMYARENDWFIENAAVLPERQGQGLGRRLMGLAEEEARHHGQSRLVLYTNEKMTENLDFYGKLGFIETGRVTENGFHRIYLEKEIGP